MEPIDISPKPVQPSGVVELPASPSPTRKGGADTAKVSQVSSASFKGAQQQPLPTKKTFTALPLNKNLWERFCDFVASIVKAIFPFLFSDVVKPSPPENKRLLLPPAAGEKPVTTLVDKFAPLSPKDASQNTPAMDEPAMARQAAKPIADKEAASDQRNKTQLSKAELMARLAAFEPETTQPTSIAAEISFADFYKQCEAEYEQKEAKSTGTAKAHPKTVPSTTTSATQAEAVPNNNKSAATTAASQVEAATTAQPAKVNSTPPGGISNPGNSCYMNATLQAILAALGDNKEFIAKMAHPIAQINLNTSKNNDKAAQDAFIALWKKLADDKNFASLYKTWLAETPRRSPEKFIDDLTAQYPGVTKTFYDSFNLANTANMRKYYKVLQNSLDSDRKNRKPIESSRKIAFDLLRNIIALGQREQIRRAFANFNNAYIAKEDSQNLMLKVTNLRDTIFASNALDIGDLKNSTQLTGQQDAAAFFEVLFGDALNFRHETVKTKLSLDERYMGRSETELQSLIRVAMDDNAQTSATVGSFTKELSVQGIIDYNFGKRVETDIQNPWKPDAQHTFDSRIDKTDLQKDLGGVFAMQFKRFEFDPITQQPRKIATPLSFPKDGSIDLSKARGETIGTTKAELKSFVVHVGSESVNGGHYIAYVKKGDQWYWCSDDQVVELTQKNIAAAKAAGVPYARTIKMIDEARKDAYLAFFEVQPNQQAIQTS